MVVLVANILIGFFMMPFLIHSLGDEQYGIWILVGSIIAFYNLLDFGMSGAMQRFLIRAIHGDEPEDVNTALSTSFIFSGGIGIFSLLITIIIVAAAPLFSASENNTLLFQIAIGITGIKVATQLPLFTFYGILVANYRYDIISYLQLGFLILRTCLIVYFVSIGHGIITVALISALADIAGSLAIIKYAKNMAPEIRLGIKYFSLPKLKEYFHFGIAIYFILVAHKIKYSLDDLVVGGIIGLAAVTHYTVAAMLISYFFLVIGSAFGVITPVMDKYHKLGQWDNLREIFLVTSEITAYTSVLIGGLLISLGNPFISLWMGHAYLDAYPALVILCASAIIVNAQSTVRIVLIAIAKHSYYAKLLCIEAISNLALSLILAQYIGIYGVALGTTIPSLVVTLFLLPRYTCSQLEIDLREYYWLLARSILFGILIFLPVFYISHAVTIDSYLDLITIGLVVCVIYAFICLKLLTGNDTNRYILESMPNGILPVARFFFRKFS